ncbi:hypothetical protein [Haploplasma axanthum]|uniref:Uncharacterized protein n=1 Tax=Haploplasma axanthum TaxID=29552 RepID=A0A449BDJ9_HAPAX|nr:hypothetical protein [Haploplasma axanthum]VEU80531.1 Uncharacterised protein [Haploplasma axanthum]
MQSSVNYTSYEQTTEYSTSVTIGVKHIEKFEAKPSIEIKELIKISGVGFEETEETTISRTEIKTNSFKLDNNMPKGYYTFTAVYQTNYYTYRHTYGRNGKNGIDRSEKIGQGDNTGMYLFTSKKPALAWVYTGNRAF